MKELQHNKVEENSEAEVLEKVANADTFEKVEEYMKELLEMEVNTQTHNLFPKIKKCVNIVANSEKNLEIREAIISKIVDDFFPLLNSEERAGEIIKVNEIDSLANQLGGIIIEHEQDDNFKKTCASAFIETIILKD